jgi:hypothetical protein
MNKPSKSIATPAILALIIWAAASISVSHVGASLPYADRDFTYSNSKS